MMRGNAAVSLLLATMIACSLGPTAQAAFLSNQASLEQFGTTNEEHKSSNRYRSSPSSFLSLPNKAGTAASKRWTLNAANGGTDTDTDTAETSSSVEVVLFGVGDLRTNDHHGLYKALTATAATSILPICFLSDDQLKSLPNAISHTADTAGILAAALQDLEQSLLRDYGLSLQVQLTGKTSVSQALVQLVSDYTSDSDIRVHVLDLGDADNAMGYGSLGALQNGRASDTTEEAVAAGLPDHHMFGLPAHMEVETWTSHLRKEPWTTGNRLPDKYTEYEAVYALQSKPPEKPLVMPTKKVDESHVWKKLLSSSSSSDVPTAEMIQNRIMTVLELDPARCEAERNTGLFSTHWGGLDPSTVGSSFVESNLKAFCGDCQEQDDLWSEHEAYVTRSSRSNERSLEHAAMRWQLAGSGKFPTGHTENWLAGESMTRYLAAPLFLGTISPATVWHASHAQNYRAFFSSPLQRLVEGQEWHRLLAARNIESNPAYSGQGPTTYRYWRWHGYLCRYAVTNLTETAPAAAVDTDNHQEGIVLIHGFGASATQWNKAMQELAKISPTASQGLAPDLIGFGQSEKPALSYTSYLWDSYSIDFVKEIATGAHKWDSYSVGGNSIGGFTAISVAASDTAEIDSRSVSSSGAPGTGKCTGLVLMNSAGPLLSREEIEVLQTKGPGLQIQSVAQNTAMNALPVCKPLARPIARAFGNGLLGVLRPRIESICKNLYPTNPAAVDEALCEGILRDSLDPGAINVMISGGKLPPPRTVNELLAADFGGVVSREGLITESTFAGPVLISMGVLDPLNDAMDRAIRFGALRKGISVDEIQAGHWYVNSSPRYEQKQM